MSGSRFYHISPQGQLDRVSALADALEAVKTGGYIWLDYCEPTKAELSVLIEPLGLHPLSIEDCVDQNEVPKIEDFPGNVFIIFNSFSYADTELSIDEVDLFLGKDFLVTVSGFCAEGRRPLQGIEQIIETHPESVADGPAFLMHVILDRIVDEKFVAIEALEDDMDKAEEALLAAPADFSPQEILRLRRDLLALRKSLFHEREILVKISRKDFPFISDKAIFHYRDIYDHLARSFELAETYRDILTSLMELYASMLNNLMAKSANEMNSTVRRLTFITTVFMPLTLLASIGGMSEWTMMTGPHNWKVAYSVFILAMAVIGVVNYYLLRRIERPR